MTQLQLNERPTEATTTHGGEVTWQYRVTRVSGPFVTREEVAAETPANTSLLEFAGRCSAPSTWLDESDDPFAP